MGKAMEALMIGTQFGRTQLGYKSRILSTHNAARETQHASDSFKVSKITICRSSLFRDKMVKLHKFTSNRILYPPMQVTSGVVLVNHTCTCL